MARDDDALLVLGGFGDPLLHPQFADVLAAIRVQTGPQSAAGLCVRTAGVHLTEERIDTLITHRVDVIQITLDAWSPELYARLQAPTEPAGAQLTTVLENIDQLLARRADARSALPLLVPDFTKSTLNLDEMEAFYDGWLRRNGAVSVTGYSNRAGQCDDRSVIRMAPPNRFPCRRLASRCLVLADGSVTHCDQDFRGIATIGHLDQADLRTLWRGESMARLRAAHQAADFGASPLCQRCSEWHRP
jgi:radical SAM protein with 4Fe4S-binding SPASM domain